MASTSIFVDTSWFKALLDGNDTFHNTALGQLDIFKKRDVYLVTSNFVVDETLTLIRVKNGLELALKFRNVLLEMVGRLKITRVLTIDESKAWKWFPKNWSQLSFTDCTSFAVMERLGLKRVATFDNHFSRAGFQME